MCFKQLVREYMFLDLLVLNIVFILLYNEDMNKKLYLPLVVLLVLLLLLSIFANVRLIVSGRASSSSTFSAENSYIFASPLIARANNTDKIRVTVFVLNHQGLGVANQQVLLNKSPELLIEQQNSLTDSYGRAIFDLSTTVGGEYVIEAVVDNTKLSESVKIKFN